MNTKAGYIIVSLMLSAGTLMAQSTAGQTKETTSGQKTAEAGKQGNKPQSGKTSSTTSQATTGTPPTHIDKTNSVPAASNPQNTGVNASNRKKSGATVQGGKTKQKNAAKKAEEPK